MHNRLEASIRIGAKMKMLIALVNYFLIYLTLSSDLIHTVAIDHESTRNLQEQSLDSGKTAIVKDQQQQQQQQQQPKFNYEDLRRPIWNLAHMVNSIKELDYRLEKGANAVEVDITFDGSGTPIFTYHGPPCDCWRHCHQQEDFNDYLRYVREIAIESNDGIGKNLTLLFLDLKLDYLDHQGKVNAGNELAKALLENLYAPSETSVSNSTGSPIPTIRNFAKRPLNLIISVNHVTDVELIYNLLHYFEISNQTNLMNNHIGFDVGMNDDLHLIDTMWKRFGPTMNLWQGDGYTNCFSPFYNLERLSKALIKRDQEVGFPKKVYHWTIDLHDRMRESLMMGVDAIMTNHPERLVTVLKEPDMIHNYRLATEQDNPFKKITRSSIIRSSESARYQRSTYPKITGGFFGNLADVIASWFTYIREIPFLSLPTTSRFIPKIKRHKSSANNMASRSSNSQLQGLNETTSISDSIFPIANGTANATQPEKPYEGTKWYSSMTSNLLVSMMKVLLPDNSVKNR